MTIHTDIMQELKEQAEKKLSMSWNEIMNQADNDTRLKNQKPDPIELVYNESSISPKKLFKKHMKKIK